MSTGLPASHGLRLGGLTKDEALAWGGFLGTHARLTHQMDLELRAEHDLPLAYYDVLRQVAVAPEGRIRLSDLAEKVMLTRGGLTGVVDRLEGEGLLTRARAPEDRRGYFACLTRKGARVLQEAHTTHLRSIRTHFARRLTKEELAALGRIWKHLAV